MTVRRAWRWQIGSFVSTLESCEGQGAVVLIPCTDAAQLVEFTSPWGPIFGRKPQQFTSLPWVFRGHANSNYPLIPSALRPDARFIKSSIGPWEAHRQGYGQIKNWQQALAELQTLASFYQLADVVGLSLPEESQLLRDRMLHPDVYLADLQKKRSPWPPSEILSLMGIAQHHGLPTRLLDWTRDINTALYFACVSAAQEQTTRPKNSSGSPSRGGKKWKTLDIWALDLTSATVPMGQPRSRSKKQTRLIVSATAPASGNANLHAQRGLFTLDNPELFKSKWKANADFRSLDAKIRALACPTQALLYCFRLPIEQSRKLLALLARERVTGAELFPGFDGVVRALKERNWREMAGRSEIAIGRSTDKIPASVPR